MQSIHPPLPPSPINACKWIFVYNILYGLQIALGLGLVSYLLAVAIAALDKAMLSSR